MKQSKIKVPTDKNEFKDNFFKLSSRSALEISMYVGFAFIIFESSKFSERLGAALFVVFSVALLSVFLANGFFFVAGISMQVFMFCAIIYLVLIGRNIDKILKENEGLFTYGLAGSALSGLKNLLMLAVAYLLYTSIFKNSQ